MVQILLVSNYFKSHGKPFYFSLKTDKKTAIAGDAKDWAIRYLVIACKQANLIDYMYEVDS